MNKKFFAFILGTTLLASTFVGCSSSTAETPESNTDSSVSLDTNSTTDPNKPKFTRMIPPDLFPAKATLIYDYLGLSFDLPDTLREACLNKTVIMNGDFAVNNDAKRLDFANIYFALMDDQFTDDIAFVTLDEAWLAQAYKPFSLGVYHQTYLAANPLETTFPTFTHTKVGEMGEYVFYTSANTELPTSSVAVYEEVVADFDLLAKSITVTEPVQLTDACKESVFNRAKVTEGNIGEFETEDIFGNKVTEDIFAQNDLTLVNIYTTWCSPCVKEIPDLQAIDAEMDNVGVVGFVMDVIDPTTNAISQAKLDIAHQLTSKTGAEYPMLLPCPELMDGRLRGVTSYPESFFVDKNGQIVGETYVGAHDKQGWIDVINQTLALVEQ